MFTPTEPAAIVSNHVSCCHRHNDRHGARGSRKLRTRPAPEAKSLSTSLLWSRLVRERARAQQGCD